MYFNSILFWFLYKTIPRKSETVADFKLLCLNTFNILKYLKHISQLNTLKLAINIIKSKKYYCHFYKINFWFNYIMELKNK